MRARTWQGKNVIITGGSAGLGLDLVKVLVEQGVAKLLIVARNEHRLEEAKSQFSSQSNVRILTLSADLSRSKDAAELSEYLVRSSFGPVDLLINAVGLSDRGTVLHLSADRLHELVDANVVSTLLAAQTVFPHLRKPGSVIVNIGSLASLFAPRFLGGYAIAKHALAGLTQQMRLEFAAEGVHVLLVCPGPIRRADSADRYRELSNATALPADALRGGGGAKLSGLDSYKLAATIVAKAAGRANLMIRPRKARCLQMIAAISSKLGDYILRKMSS